MICFFKKKKRNEFDLIKRKRSRYYDPGNIEFYLFPHVYLVEDHLRPSKIIAIPAKAEDCYNEMEYQAFDNMMDICLRFGYDTIRNPHHHPNNKSYLSSKSYFVPSENITSYKKLIKNELNYPLGLNVLSPIYFRPHFGYDSMSKEQRDLILKTIDIDPQVDDFLLVLGQAHEMLEQQKKDMGKVLDVTDIAVRIKIGVIYNDFGSRFPK
jgi:hypothetical protein